VKRAFIGAVRAIGHAALSPIERSLAGDEAMAAPPIFIVGPPRSGTSLVYEAMITRYRFAYMSNLAHRFFLTPVAATWLGRRAITGWRGDFVNHYGHIEGWGAPNEGGWIWRRWLADGDWRDESGRSTIDVVAMRRVIAGLSRAIGAPFLNKNVMHSNRMRLIDAIWPGALFIEVRRDPRENARSIIRAERREGGPEPDADHWWSVRPSIAPRYLGGSDIDRAAAQVLGVRADIARDAATLPAGNLFALDYARFCDRPEFVLGEVADWLSGHGIAVHLRGTVPERFGPESRPLDDQDEAALTRALESIGRIIDGN